MIRFTIYLILLFWQIFQHLYVSLVPVLEALGCSVDVVLSCVACLS